MGIYRVCQRRVQICSCDTENSIQKSNRAGWFGRFAEDPSGSPKLPKPTRYQAPTLLVTKFPLGNPSRNRDGVLAPNLAIGNEGKGYAGTWEREKQKFLFRQEG